MYENSKQIIILFPDVKRTRDKRQSDLHGKLILRFSRTLRNLSVFSLLLSPFLLASAITRSLSIFVRAERISFVEKFYFPPFDAIEMQTPLVVLASRRYFRFAQSETCYARTFEILRCNMDLRQHRGRMKEHSQTPCTHVSARDAAVSPCFFISSEFLACLHALQLILCVHLNRSFRHTLLALDILSLLTRQEYFINIQRFTSLIN